MKMPIARICSQSEVAGVPVLLLIAKIAINPSAIAMFAPGPAAPTSAASRRG